MYLFCRLENNVACKMEHVKCKYQNGSLENWVSGCIRLPVRIKLVERIFETGIYNNMN